MSTATITTRAEPRWWVPGDWNGFFGLFTNVLLNVIVITGLCLGVVKLPDRHCHRNGVRAGGPAG
jgi:AGZA family xanthine/uracil permease-like MFS transporter